MSGTTQHRNLGKNLRISALVLVLRRLLCLEIWFRNGARAVRNCPSRSERGGGGGGFGDGSGRALAQADERRRESGKRRRKGPLAFGGLFPRSFVRLSVCKGPVDPNDSAKVHVLATICLQTMEHRTMDLIPFPRRSNPVTLHLVTEENQSIQAHVTIFH